MPDPEKMIVNPSDYHTLNTASFGVFICTPGNPFDADALTGDDKGKLGAAVYFYEPTGNPTLVSVFETSGVLGDSTALVQSYAAGVGIAVTVKRVTVTQGQAWIYLKQK